MINSVISTIKGKKSKVQKFKIYSIYCKLYCKTFNFDILDSQEFDPISQICYGYD